MRTAFLLLLVLASAANAQTPRVLGRGLTLDTLLAARTVHEYVLRLGAGESSLVTVHQNGIDVVVEIRDARDSVVLSMDSPNGRNGDEPVELFSARAQRYSLRIRPFNDNEPSGRYSLSVNALRTAAETKRLLTARKLTRDSASAWLAQRSASVASLDQLHTASNIAPLDDLARRAQVLGLGEATHGSREFNDARLAITKRLIEKHGYRLVAIEASAIRLSENAAMESGWIGRRTQHELVDWVRAYNSQHADDSVRVVGLDAQDFMPALSLVGTFIKNAYGAVLLQRWDTIAGELAAADSQAAVFGNSNVKASVRAALFELVALVHIDRALLTHRFGSAAERAIDALEIIAQFADYNSGANSPASHGRDWYMAANLLKRLQASRANTKAVLWQHNAHVAKVAGRTTGGVLREVLGCDYAAIALTFGSGAFIAQVPNDQQNRLAVSSLPIAPDESVERVLAAISDDMRLAAWSCNQASTSLPRWLQQPQRMHWVGALFAPGTPPTEAFRPFDLINQFDAILYIPRVTADEIYSESKSPPNGSKETAGADRSRAQRGGTL